MLILIPPSEGKAKIQKPQDILFQDTGFVFEKHVRQVVRLLNLIDLLINFQKFFLKILFAYKLN